MLNHPVSNNKATCVFGHWLLATSQIDNHETLSQLISQITTSYPGFSRISFNQLDSVFYNWGTISHQHNLIQQFKDEKIQRVHLSTPLDSFTNMLEQEKASFEKLPKLLNAEAWIQYCQWLNEEIESIDHQIKLESAEEYTLQAHLNDFEHEVHSTLLQRIQEHLLQLQAKPYEISAEKELLKARFDLARQVKAHLLILKKILPFIKSHLKVKIELLIYLLDEETNFDWKQREILLQILEKEFQVISTINSVNDLNEAYAIRLAVLSLFKDYTSQNILELVVPSPSFTDQQRQTLYEKFFELQK